MKRLFFLLTLICLSARPGFAQERMNEMARPIIRISPLYIPAYGTGERTDAVFRRAIAVARSKTLVCRSRRYTVRRSISLMPALKIGRSPQKRPLKPLAVSSIIVVGAGF